MIHKIVAQYLASLKPSKTDLAWGGSTLEMPLAEEVFVHFTTEKRAVQILESGVLLHKPPYKKFGGDAVYAISTTFGRVVRGTQTTHITEGPVVALRFQTDTLPKIAFVEEVVWNQDVRLTHPKLLSESEGLRLIQASPVTISEDDAVLYVR